MKREPRESSAMEREQRESSAMKRERRPKNANARVPRGDDAPARLPSTAGPELGGTGVQPPSGNIIAVVQNTLPRQSPARPGQIFGLHLALPSTTPERNHEPDLSVRAPDDLSQNAFSPEVVDDCVAEVKCRVVNRPRLQAFPFRYASRIPLIGKEYPNSADSADDQSHHRHHYRIVQLSPHFCMRITRHEVAMMTGT